MSPLPEQCLHCGGSQLFTRRVNAGGPDGPYLLEGLGGFLRFAKFHVVMCADCGRCEFFAEDDARQKVAEHWRRVGDAG